MEQLQEPKRRKIQQAVSDILRTSDLETVTEFTVRTNVAQQLGIEIFNLEEKHFIRHVIESFLLSTAEKGTSNFVTEEQFSANPPQQVQESADVSLSKGRVVDSDETNSRTICKLSDKRSVGTLDIQGKTFVSIRDFYEKDGKLIPSARAIKGVHLKVWSHIEASI